MADYISQITLPDQSTYDLKDQNATHFKGVAVRNDLANDSIIDPFDSSANPRHYAGEQGDIVLDSQGSREYIWDGSSWRIFGFYISQAYDSSSLTATELDDNDNYSWISDIEQDSDGTISVTKTYINILPISHGGTGNNSFEKNQVIISNNPNSGTAATSLISRAYADTRSANALSSESEDFVTERYIYYGLPTINGNHNYNSSTTLFVPITAGSSNSLLISSGSGAPIWTSTASISNNSSTTVNQSAITNLTLGNSTNISSSQAHSEGQITLYSSGTGSHTLAGASTTGTSYIHTMPNVTGTFVQFTGSNGAGGTNQPVYITSSGTATALTYTTNRIYYGASSTSFEATNHYISSNTMSIGSTSAPNTGVTLNINGITTISNTTNSTATTNGALVVSGGVGIANALRVGGILNVTGAATLNSTSQLTGNVGIGGAPDTGTGSHILKIIGSTLISTSSNSIAHLDIGTSQNNSTELEFYPDSDGTGYIGKSNNRWRAGYFNNELEIGSSTNQVNLNGNGSILIKHGSSSINLATVEGNNAKAEIILEDTTPTISLTSTATNSSDWSIYNSSGNFIITDSSQTELKGNAQGFDLKRRLYINETQSSTIGAGDSYTLYVGGDQYNDGNLYIQGDILPTDTASLGASGNGNRWSAVYVGTSDQYGDAYQPIYWNNGVPAPVSMILRAAFTIQSGKLGVELSNDAFTEDSWVAQIVVTSGVEYLNSPINYTTSTGKVRLTCDAVGGQVSGYILVIRGSSISPTSSPITNI